MYNFLRYHQMFFIYVIKLNGHNDTTMMNPRWGYLEPPVMRPEICVVDEYLFGGPAISLLAKNYSCLLPCSLTGNNSDHEHCFNQNYNKQPCKVCFQDLLTGLGSTGIPFSSV